jgi:DNA-binding transcriptional ArsR family regulator
MRDRPDAGIEKQDVIAALAALAHETRLDVFRLLVVAGDAGLMPSEIARALDVPPATLSFHLKELKNAQLARVERRGRSLVYRAAFDTMRHFLEYLTRNCCQGPSSGTDRA